MKINVAVKIFLYIGILIVMSHLPSSIFLLFCASTFFIAFLLEQVQFLQRCIKLQWLFISIFFVYAITTPGEYLIIYDEMLGVTKEGVSMAFMQIAKVIMAIACLRILFYRTSINQLVGGLCQLLYPIQIIGLNIERFAVRLFLTLHYVDNLTLTSQRKAGFIDVYHQIISPSSDIQLNMISFEKEPLAKIDLIFMSLIIIAMMILLQLS
jgi:energy-coupling factor transporter transmembrane protein EcfT